MNYKFCLYYFFKTKLICDAITVFNVSFKSKEKEKNSLSENKIGIFRKC